MSEQDSRLTACVIAVTQNDSPSDKEVAQLHSQVVATIEAMYYRHRHLVPGFETRPLIIA